MRKLIFSFSMLLATFAYASEPAEFSDAESGFTFKIPEGLSQTWNLSHHQYGVEVNTFHSEISGDEFNIVIIAKIPFEDLEAGDFSTLSMNEIVQNLALAEFAFEEGDGITLATLPSLSHFSPMDKRIRFTFTDEDLEVEAAGDCHLILQEDCGYIVVSGIASENAIDLDAFSQKVIDSISFNK